ncbi:MAG: hypothetical protein JJE17_09170 [Peptostreptococcaceae bacterium]|nr:hypothetical protein [Peptostreptococcaceae bacterium]
MQLQEAYQVLNEMMKTFETWFPIEDSDTKEEIEMYKERFAATKLCIELGEYTKDDYEYLFFIYGLVVDNMVYYKAIGVFIGALSEEYGWI